MNTTLKLNYSIETTNICEAFQDAGINAFTVASSINENNILEYSKFELDDVCRVLFVESAEYSILADKLYDFAMSADLEFDDFIDTVDLSKEIRDKSDTYLELYDRLDLLIKTNF